MVPAAIRSAWHGLSRGQWLASFRNLAVSLLCTTSLATSLLRFASVLVETTPLCSGLFELRFWRDPVFSF
jgi:hypothetical protein